MAKRGHYGKWSTEEMEMAVAAMRNGDCGLNECARQYGVPKATLLQHVNGKNVRANEGVKKMGRNETFCPEIEGQLVEHMLSMESKLFGLTIKNLRRLAYEIAEKNEIKHNFNKTTKLAGKKRHYSSMKRHPNLSLRHPESTSMARAKGFNRERVMEFFDILENLCDKHNFDAKRIYNVDESGFSTVQKKASKVVGMKGKHQIGALASGERGVNTTIVCCLNAAGVYVPPMIIFKRKRFIKELSVGAPPGSVVTISDTGYIHSELFITWLQHFIDFVRTSIDKPVLLLLDGHTTHSKNLAALELARERGVVLLQLPAHTTHRMQLLDVALFKPLGTYYIQAMESWLRTNVGATIGQLQISQLLGEAYGRAATVATAISCFSSYGIWPVNRNVFPDHHFAAAEILTPEVESDQAPDLPDADISDEENYTQLFNRRQRISTFTRTRL